jgi:hypothetical protein
MSYIYYVQYKEIAILKFQQKKKRKKLLFERTNMSLEDQI